MAQTRKFRDITPRVPTGGDRFKKPGSLPKTISGFAPNPLRLRGGVPDEFVFMERDPYLAWWGENERADLEARAVSLAEVYGSVHERITYRELLERRIPFDFQSSLIGARRVGGQLEPGAIVPDFVLLDRPVIISVEGGSWHRGLDAEVRDVLQRSVLADAGWVVYVLRDHIIEHETLLRDWFFQYIDVPVPARPTPEMLAMIGVGEVAYLPTRIGEPLVE